MVGPCRRDLRPFGTLQGPRKMNEGEKLGAGQCRALVQPSARIFLFQLPVSAGGFSRAPSLSCARADWLSQFHLS